MGRDFIEVSTEYLNAGNITAMDGVSTLSMSMWAKRNASGNAIISKISGATNNTAIFHFGTDDYVYFNCGNATTTNGKVEDTRTGVWIHYGYVFDGGETGTDRMRGYIDGELKTLTFNNTPPATVDSNGADFLIGARTTFPQYTDGLIGEVKVWSTALSAGEVKTDKTGIMVQPENLLGYWRVGVDSPEPDWSGNGNSASLVATPTIDDHPPVTNPYCWDQDFAPYAVAAVAGGSPVGSLNLMGCGR